MAEFSKENTMYFNQNVWQGVTAAASWASQFPAHYFPTMSRLEYRAWFLAAKRREKIVTLSRETTLGAWREQFTELVICSIQFGFRRVNTSTDPRDRGPSVHQMKAEEAFQAIADLEARLNKKRAIVKKLTADPIWFLDGNQIVTRAAELRELAQVINVAINVADQWFGVNYHLAIDPGWETSAMTAETAS